MHEIGAGCGVGTGGGRRGYGGRRRSSGEPAMRGRTPQPLVLHAADVPVLEALARDGRTEQRVAWRARILRAVAGGARIGAVAAQTGCDPATIWRICRRYERLGLDAVRGAPVAGRPRTISPPRPRAHREPGLHRPRRERARPDPLV